MMTHRVLAAVCIVCEPVLARRTHDGKRKNIWTPLSRLLFSFTVLNYCVIQLLWCAGRLRLRGIAFVCVMQSHERDCSLDSASVLVGGVDDVGEHLGVGVAARAMASIPERARPRIMESLRDIIITFRLRIAVSGFAIVV